jgi:hypothetical protein
VLVLGEDLQKGIGRHAGSQRAQRNRRLAHALDPEIARKDLMPPGDDGVREIELPVEFERAGLHGDGARGRPRLGGLVDDPDLDAQLRQPKRQHEPGRARARDQNV